MLARGGWDGQANIKNEMDIFLILLAKLIPLYLVIFLGFIIGKKLEVKKETLAAVLIYAVAPVVVFDGVVRTELSGAILSIIPLFFVLGAVVCLLALWISKKLWSDNTPNIMGYAAANGNVGYFGLPVVVSIFGEGMLGVSALVLLGAILFGDTIGYYTIARGNYHAREAFRKVITLPTVYAFLLGVIANKAGMPLGGIYTTITRDFRGVFVILGMMIIGMGLADIKKYEWDFKFLSIPFVAKFLAWPLLMLFVVYLDSNFFHFYSPIVHRVLMLLSLVPLGTNTVVYATQLRVHPEKTAAAVLLSTLFAIFYIPLIVSLFLR
jgi:hypothetical protein